MDAATAKSLNRALFTLTRARRANPRLDIQPPSPEEIEGARCALQRLDGLQFYQALVEHPEIVGNLLSP